MGDRLFFAADDGLHGDELWVLALTPATVEGIVVNDGSAQRSRVTSLTVTFSSTVTLQPGAFELLGPGGAPVGLDVTTSVADGKTVAVLTFAGPGLLGGSLADGNYTLLLHGDRVRDDLGQPLDGDGAPGGDHTDAFFRLFGDSDGDGDVDRLDRDLFRSAFPTTAGDAGYLWYFDFDGDGDVDGRDQGQFSRRFGRSVMP